MTDVGAHSSPYLRAALFCVVAMAGISVIDNFIALMARDIGLIQFHVSRSTVGCTAVALLAWLLGQSLRPLSWFAVGLRSLMIALAMVLYFGALGLLPIAETLAGLFTSPLWVLAISALFLGQAVGPWRIGAVVMGFVGCVMVLRPDPTTAGLVTLMPLAAGVFYACAAIVTREMCADENPLTLLFGFFAALGVIGVLATMIVGPDGAGNGFLLRGWKWPLWTSWAVIFLQAFGTGFAVFLLTRAYQMAPASYVAGFEYSALVFAPLIALLLWGDRIDLWAAIGIALIITSGVVIALREMRA